MLWISTVETDEDLEDCDDFDECSGLLPIMDIHMFQSIQVARSPEEALQLKNVQRFRIKLHTDVV